jgi:ubiquinone/menaquinone biosynthesis C-methylase UbiE
MSRAERSPKEFFSTHAEDYAKSESHAHGSDLSILVQLLEPKVSDTVLDVGAGTGFISVELAGHVTQVIGLDLTREMLLEARKLAVQRGMENLTFGIGVAENLPFSDSNFEIVTTRRAAHHFRNIDKFLNEARRVLVNKGKVGVVDMSPPEGTQDFFNGLEKIRDATHGRALTPEEWQNRAGKAGFEITTCEIHSEPLTLEKWLYPVRTGGDEESGVREKLSNAPNEIAEKLNFTYQNGKVSGWTKSRIVMVATKS